MMNNEQLIAVGTADTGKSFTVAALTKLYIGLLKRACLTAKAAFLLKGETLHSLLSIPVITRETDTFLPLKNKQLKDSLTEPPVRNILWNQFHVLEMVSLELKITICFYQEYLLNQIKVNLKML